MKKSILFLALMMCLVIQKMHAAEIYAVLNATDSILTLRYDDLREAKGGVTDWKTDDFKAKTAIVVLDESMKAYRPTSLANWFLYFNKMREIQHLDYLNTSEVTSMGSMFYGCEALETMDVSKFNTEKVTSMYTMFLRCKKLKALDLSNFNTENVKNMSSMFDRCESLTTLDLSSFNTPLLEGELSYMFRGCKGLTSLILGSGFDVSKATNMKEMFKECAKLTSLDLSYFNPASVTNMDNMFSGCTALTSLDLRSFYISNVLSSDFMFYNCSQLKTLDLSNATFAKDTSAYNMFANCSQLTTIYCNYNFSTSEAMKRSSGMFSESKLLVGGNGTPYDGAHIDKEYARVDEAGTPGYFTAKGAVIVTAAEYTGFAGTIQLGGTWNDDTKNAAGNWTPTDATPWGGVAKATGKIYLQNKSTSAWDEVADDASLIEGHYRYEVWLMVNDVNAYRFADNAADISIKVDGAAWTVSEVVNDALSSHIVVRSPEFDLKSGSATGMENVQSDKVQGTKILRDGQLYLMYEGRMYDVRGQRVK